MPTDNETWTLKTYRSESGNITITLSQVWLNDYPMHYLVIYQVGDDPLSIGFVRKAQVFECDGLTAYTRANDLFSDYVKAVL